MKLGAILFFALVLFCALLSQSDAKWKKLKKLVSIYYNNFNLQKKCSVQKYYKNRI